MIHHCRGCSKEVIDTCLLLCTKCSEEYLLLEEEWRLANNQKIDYAPFSVMASFIKMKENDRNKHKQ